MADADLATLRELMGHSTISTKMRYVHPTPQQKPGALNTLEGFKIEQVFARIESRTGRPYSNFTPRLLSAGKLLILLMRRDV